MNIYQCYTNNPFRALVYGASAASALFLSVALIGQYGFDLHPCELCMAQRVPYALIAMFGLLAGMYLKSEQKLGQVALLCGILFVIDAALAIYHSGVEYGVFKGPSGCTNNDMPGQSLEAMRQAIMSAQLVPCDQPMAHFLGLSMASWNAFAACAMALVTFYAFWRIRQRQKRAV